MCHFKTTGQKVLTFWCFTIEVYTIDWPNGQWAGPTYVGHTPTLQLGLLQCKIGQPVWLLSHTVHNTCVGVATKPSFNQSFDLKIEYTQLLFFKIVICVLIKTFSVGFIFSWFLALKKVPFWRNKSTNSPRLSIRAIWRGVFRLPKVEFIFVLVSMKN